jgi:hypothetical protein
MNTKTLNIKLADNYFRFLKNLDTESKKRLIIRLTESIEIREEPGKLDILFGAWKDSRNADEIIEDIRKSRVNIREIEDLQ